MTYPEKLPAVWLVRHGETDWSVSRRHTGRTDIPLTERGELDATRLGTHLIGTSFAGVLTSPLQRAARTCQLAGYAARCEIDEIVTLERCLAGGAVELSQRESDVTWLIRA